MQRNETGKGWKLIILFWHLVIYPDNDSGPYECGTSIILLNTIYEDMQSDVKTGIVYWWNRLR